ncbi:MAG: hypothetical protein QXQ29_06570 [Candidatus Bathyarchaeia archaeon]
MVGAKQIIDLRSDRNGYPKDAKSSDLKQIHEVESYKVLIEGSMRKMKSGDSIIPEEPSK